MFEIVFSVLVLLSSVAVMIGGIALIRFSKKATSKSLQKYSCKVKARIAGKQKTYINDNDFLDVYSTVYEYMYQDRYYRAVSKSGSGNNNAKIGSAKKIYIDPYNPEDIYEPNVTGKFFSALGVITGVFWAMTAVLAIVMCIGVFMNLNDEAAMNNMLTNSDYSAETITSMDFALAETIIKRVIKTLIIFVCLVAVCFTDKVYKKKSERCCSEVCARVANTATTANGYGMNMAAVNPMALEYSFGQTYTKSLPEFVGMIILKAKPQGVTIYVNPDKPTEVYQHLDRKIAMLFVSVIAGIVGFTVFCSMLVDFIIVTELYRFIF